MDLPKPCPFCGAEFDALATRPRDAIFECEGRHQMLICSACGARGPEADRTLGAIEAVRAWNRRFTATTTRGES